MDIYILRDGKEIGPFSEETTQTLLKQGSVSINDLAWKPGMADWIPLHSVLYPAPIPTPSAKPPPPPKAAGDATAAAGGSEQITARQKAFLTFMGIPFTDEMTKEQAALLVNDTMENPKDPGRIARWNEERLRLHPELFAAEIQARKDNRSNHFFQVAETKGAECFTKVTKAHCQVLVGYLDVRFPNWDANEEDATWSYFFPAVAEKFPQLVRKEWKGKLNYSQGPKVAPELRRGTTPLKPGRKAGAFPILAAFRGLFIGLLVLGVLYAGYEGMRRGWFNPKNFTFAKPAQPAAGATASPAPMAPTTPAPADPSAIPPADATLDAAPAAPTADPNSEMIAATPADVATPSAPAGEVPFLDLSTPPATGTPTAQTPVPDAAGAPKTTLTVTRKISVRTRFGSVDLLPGQVLKLVAREGAMVRARHPVGDVISIPVGATDLEAPATPPPSLF
ncbi:MAG TPA: GYF domain-containing protein [Chthoniobacteraceae bacterium]|jgi:hypothetical protein